MARRANDPDLLRAQAQNGRQGENAWRQANAALTAQRQAAVQQAMQEAAMRGAPANAVAQIQNRVAAPYNSAITNNTQMGAAFAGDMSARRGRMYDYNQAVLAARQLIPAQIQQTLAPIRAENRFQLQSLRQEGQNRVSEIEAQTALQLAQIRAEERLRQQAAQAAGLGSLNEGDLQAALSQGALGILNPAAQGIASAVEQGRETESLNQIQDIIGRGMTMYPAAQATDAARQQAAANMYGATYMAKGLAELRGQDVTGTGGAPEPDIERYQRVFSEPEGQPKLFEPSAGSQFGEAERLTPGGFDASWNPNLGVTGTSPVAPTADPLAAQQAMLDAQLGKASAATDIFRDVRDKYRPVLSIPQPQVQPLSQYGALSEEQVQGLPDFAQGLVTQAAASGETFNTPEDVRRILFGKPEITIDRLTGQGTAAVSPYAADVKQAVMGMVAQRLAAQGYDITSPELANAIMSTPESLYDLAAGQTGQPTTPDLISQAEQEADRRKLSKEARVKTNRTDIEQQFRGQFKMPIPTNVGSVEDVAEAAFSPQFLATWDQLQQILGAAGWDMDYDEAISAAFAKAGGDPTAFTPFMRAVMKGMLP